MGKQMTKQEAVDFILSELAKRRSRDDIIQELCQRTGGSVEQVRQFVQFVESQNPFLPPPPVSAPVVSPARPAQPPPVVKPIKRDAVAAPVAAPVSAPESAVSIARPASTSTDTLDTPENTTFVISEIATHRNRNDIIMALCEKTGSSWDQAQRFVRKVESENRQSIAARQSPILVMIGVVTIVGGLLLGAYTVIRTLNGYAWGLPGMPIPYLGNLTYAGTSLGMIGGGIVGLLRTARTLIK
jgi:hypothetical protein